jgi:serine/threonine protein kinase
VTRYELLDRIGVGGMAEIFRGRALAAGGFEKPVAIKRILPHLCQDQRFVELLIAEAKVLSMLRHRNIVQIFDVGLGDDGQYFLVMEFVHGLDLGRVQVGLESKRRILPVDLALHIGAEVCEALEHAHIVNDPDGKPMRLVHRDIAPSNVLLSLSGEVKLTDFGIAKRAEEVTSHGGVRGKFAYISPEQAKNEPVDPRSDVFSLGIVLFELLTGRRLFSGLPDLEALRAVREGKIPRPRDLDGNLPPPIDDLLGKALARDPDKRFSSAGEFGAALRALRYSLEVSSGDPSAELARVVSTAESPETIPPPRHEQFDAGEATVIRIRSAEAFSMNDTRSAISQARQVIDRFEEEETRMSKLGPEQLRNLRRAGEDVSGELAVPPVAHLERGAGSRSRSSERRIDRGVDRGVGRNVVRKSSITGDEPTAMADPIDQQRMMEQSITPRGAGESRAPLPSEDKAFDMEEETIARPTPLRGPAPTTLKRLPPPSGPGSPQGGSGQLPGVRPVPRSNSPSQPSNSLPSQPSNSLPSQPSNSLPSQPSAKPASMMPDVAGWEAPSFSASPYATPPPADRTPAPQMMNPGMGPYMGPNMGPNMASMPTVGAGPMGMAGNPMLGGPTPNPAGAMPQHLTPVPNPAMMPGAPYPQGYPHGGGNPGYPGAMRPDFERPPPQRAEGSALERWRTAALVLGAVAMAVLAFAVTRSCLHQENRRIPLPATSSAPAPASPAAPMPTP